MPLEKLIALTMLAAFVGGVAVPALAEGRGPPGNSTNSLPTGFGNGTEEQLHSQMRENWLASQKPNPRLVGQPTQEVRPTSSRPNG
jgi:hypothetical protein